MTDGKMSAVDRAIQAGALREENGQLVSTRTVDELLERLKGIREDAARLRPIYAEDMSEQQDIILGFAAAGDRDNREIWSRFRVALGLVHDQAVPAYMWSTDDRKLLADLVESTYRAQGMPLNRTGIQAHYETLQASGKVHTDLETIHQMLREKEQHVFDHGWSRGNDVQIAIALLRTDAAKRRIQSILNDAQFNLNGKRDPEEVANAMSAGAMEALNLFKGRLGSQVEAEDMTGARHSLLERIKSERSEPISLGHDGLDMDCQRGIAPGDAGKLLVMGARTGVGKTTLSVHALCSFVANGGTGLFISCELEEYEIQARCASWFSKLWGYNFPVWVLEGRGRNREKPTGWDEFWDRYEAEVGGRLRVIGKFHIDVERVAQMVQQAKAATPDLALVMLDHFHSMKPSKGYNQRSTEMEARAIELQNIAKMNKVSLLLAVQLNREAVNAQKPDIAHINGTDTIAQLASVVWLVEFDKADGKPRPDVLRLVHGKMRNGQRDKNGRQCRAEEHTLHLDREYSALVTI